MNDTPSIIATPEETQATPRLYVENVRSFFDTSTPQARRLCELAVTQGILTTATAYLCPNKNCHRVLLESVLPLEPLEKITCESCEDLEEPEFTFYTGNLRKMDCYHARPVEPGDAGETSDDNAADLPGHQPAAS